MSHDQAQTEDGFTRWQARAPGLEGSTALALVGGSPRILGAEITVGAEAGDAIAVACQLCGVEGESAHPITDARVLRAYLSTDAAGLTPVSGNPFDSLAMLAGFLIAEVDLIIVSTNAAGLVTFEFTEAATPAAHFLHLLMPDGRRVSSGAIAFA